ncbi:hypothetical protein AAFF_G00392000 [Aldrovandia affinis]|uniref:Uncharacterized protein n=1 Tax=Aldrovandia affinis TaxID=143900 RepID=A0AAD7SE32_9TELE|nr:hypothetical protein AAFF_G00392000 [Aldrovandia affinis]
MRQSRAPGSTAYSYFISRRGGRGENRFEGRGNRVRDEREAEALGLWEWAAPRAPTFPRWGVKTQMDRRRAARTRRVEGAALRSALMSSFVFAEVCCFIVHFYFRAAVHKAEG